MNNGVKKLSRVQQYKIIPTVCAINNMFKNFVYVCAREALGNKAAVAFVKTSGLAACIQYADDYIKKNNADLNIPDEVFQLNKISNKVCLPLKQDKEVPKQNYMSFSRVSDNLTIKLCNFNNDPFIGDSIKQMLADFGGENVE